jgi:hypothetical protein
VHAKPCIVTLFLILIVCAIYLTTCNITDNKFETLIIIEIDRQCTEEGECVIFLPNITNFKWDTVSVFMFGADSHSLGFAIPDISDGIVFHFKNSVVKSHSSGFDFLNEMHPKLSYWVERESGEPLYKSYDYNNAFIHAQKIRQINGKYRYMLIAK